MWMTHSQHFTTGNWALEFSERLNNLHPALQFTMEEENNGELPFLDVLIKHSSTELLTTV